MPFAPSITRRLFTLGMAILCFAATSDAQQTEATQPSIDSYILPLPDGEKMEFIFIKVSDKSNVFASTQFSMGDSLAVGYRYHPTTVTVGGSIFYYNKDKKEAMPYWSIPMAKTELTRGQYAAIMGEPKPEKPNHPQTELSKAEIYLFIEKFNQWIHKKGDAKQSPAIAFLKDCAHPIENPYPDDKSKTASKILLHGRIHVRLPNEAEWEFAARGGLNVDKAAFLKMQPYEDIVELEKCEVVARLSQSDSSEVGSTQKTNPCGLYDMLGNVSEVVENRFCPEYLYGRVGGTLLRGGNWATELPDLDLINNLKKDDNLAENNRKTAWVSSYYREEAPILQNGLPYKSRNMGFRLIIGSEIVSTSLAKTLTMQRETIANHNHSERTPGAQSSDSVSDSLARNNEKILDHLSMLDKQLEGIVTKQSGEDKENSQLKNAELTDNEKDELIAKLTNQLSQRNEQISALQSHIKPIEQKLKDNDTFKAEAQETMAKAGAELMIGATFFAVQSQEEIYRYESMLTSNVVFTREEIDALKIKSDALKQDIDFDWIRFENGCNALGKMDDDIVARELARREKIMKNEGSEADMLCFNLAKTIYAIYKRKSNLGADERDQWKAELEKIVIASHKKMNK